MIERICGEAKPIRHVKQIAVFDWDRTIGDVDASNSRLYAAAEYVGVDTDRIKKEQASIEDVGGTFDNFTFVEEQLEPDELANFYHHFMSGPGPDLMFPAAQTLLNTLDENNVPHVVRTYGVNHKLQQLKISKDGYKGSYRIMDHTDKGAEIETWRTPSGELVLPKDTHPEYILVAESAVLLDDKAIAYTSLHPGNTGFHIIAEDGKQMKSQKGRIPPNVQAAKISELTVVRNKIVRM